MNLTCCIDEGDESFELMDGVNYESDEEDKDEIVEKLDQSKIQLRIKFHLTNNLILIISNLTLLFQLQISGKIRKMKNLIFSSKRKKLIIKLKALLKNLI